MLVAFERRCRPDLILVLTLLLSQRRPLPRALPAEVDQQNGLRQQHPDETDPSRHQAHRSGTHHSPTVVPRALTAAGSLLRHSRESSLDSTRLRAATVAPPPTAPGPSGSVGLHRADAARHEKPWCRRGDEWAVQ